MNLDDLGDYRPGLRAAEELGFLAPLAEAGLTKADIRRLSREIGLDTWDKPSQSCLATRIPYNEIITGSALAKVDTVEKELQVLGFDQVRVRCHGNLARIEVAPDLIGKLLEEAMRTKVAALVKAGGFKHVSVDMEGYSTGKMNTDIQDKSD